MPESSAVITEDELLRLMDELQPAFDIVRLVDPDATQARMLDGDGRCLAQPFCCHEAIGRNERCANCVSQRAVERKESTTKYEVVDGEVFFIVTRYLELSGKPMSLEMLKKVTDTTVAMADSAGGLMARLETYNDAMRYVALNIDKAVELGHIKVFFQPVIRSLTGEVCGFEALARWEDPEYGLLSPANFIPTLERSRLIHKLDVCVLRQACARIRGSLDAGRGAVPVSVNLSRLDFELMDAFEVVEGLVEEFGVPRRFLHVEVTESAFNDDPDFLRAQVERFRGGGYEVWMDDFGSGLSSLNFLKDYRFDVMKLDRGFLQGFDGNEKSREIIMSVIDMAKKLGIQTLAEGVETQAEEEFLKGIGCELLQGYRFGYPRPYADALREANVSGLGFEDEGTRAYYNAIGRVNLLSATPLEDVDWLDGHEVGTHIEAVPVAIAEQRGGSFSFLMANAAFEELLAQLGLGAGDESLSRAFFEASSGALASGAAKSAETGEERAVCQSVMGVTLDTRIRCIAVSAAARAFVVTTGVADDIGY